MGMHKVAAIVLGAGFSTRMGAPKALLKLGETTFLGRLIHLYDRLQIPCQVVLGAEWEIISKAESLSRDHYLVNPEPERGPLSSIHLGLEELSRSSTALIPHPVDHPLVTEETLRTILARHEAYPEHILVPHYHGTPGHPTLFPATSFGDLREAPLEQGARWVVRKRSHFVLQVPVEDPGITANIDTPDDYLRWVGGQC
jgi:molybdenum cofactor cytidylyltransferase